MNLIKVIQNMFQYATYLFAIHVKDKTVNALLILAGCCALPSVVIDCPEKRDKHEQIKKLAINNRPR